MINLKGREKKILFYLADINGKERSPWVDREKLGEYIGGTEGVFEASEAIFVLNMFELAEYHPRDRHKVMISQKGLQYVNELKLMLKSKSLFSPRNLLVTLIISITAGLIVAIIIGRHPW